MSLNIDLMCSCCGNRLHRLSIPNYYNKYFHFYDLDVMVAKDAIPKLESAIKELGTKRRDDYSEPVNGDVGCEVNVLLGQAMQYPNGVFHVTRVKR